MNSHLISQSPKLSSAIFVQINDLSFNADGTLLATASSDGKVRLWELETKTCKREWVPHGGEPVYTSLFRVAKVSPGSRSSADSILLTGSYRNSQLRLWDIDRPALLQVWCIIF